MNNDNEFQDLNPHSLLENLKLSKQVNLQGKRNAYRLLNLALEKGLNAKIEEFSGDFPDSQEYKVYIDESTEGSLSTEETKVSKVVVELNGHYIALAEELLEHEDIPSFNKEDLMRDALFNLAYRTLGENRIKELFEEENNRIYDKR